jgi:hypothetical protein
MPSFRSSSQSHLQDQAMDSQIRPSRQFFFSTGRAMTTRPDSISALGPFATTRMNHKKRVHVDPIPHPKAQTQDEVVGIRSFPPYTAFGHLPRFGRVVHLSIPLHVITRPGTKENLSSLSSLSMRLESLIRLRIGKEAL